MQLRTSVRLVLPSAFVRCRRQQQLFVANHVTSTACYRHQSTLSPSAAAPGVGTTTTTTTAAAGAPAIGASLSPSSASNNNGYHNNDVMSASAVVSHIHEATAGKIVQFGGDAREHMLHGVERISRAVSVTLGPKGRNVVIRQPNGEPKITKDGVTVARSIAFSNEFEDVGAKLIRQVAAKTNMVAGDGTTTATVLAWSMFSQGYKAVATGANPMDLKRGIDLAVGVITRNLVAQARPVATREDVRNVAIISANGEVPLGSLIADAVMSVGPSGYIAVLEGEGQTQTTWSHPQGWSLEQGFGVSKSRTAFVTDNLSMTAKLLQPMVIVMSQPLKDVSVGIAILEASRMVAAGRASPLLVIAREVAADVLSLFEHNHRHNVVQCTVVEVNHEHADAVFEDIAVACGTTPLTAEALSRLSVEGIAAAAGKAEYVEQTIDSTVVKGTASSEVVAARVRFLEQQLARTADGEAKQLLKARIAKLTGKFAVVRVGGQTDVEVSETKDRVIDSLNAATAAITEGVLPGGGSALLHASRELSNILAADDEMPQDRRTGIMIVKNAVRLPMRIISDNAGVDGPVVIENVLDLNDPAKGYDAQNDAYVDMFAAGIIDPLRVVRSCIVDAASVASLMITTEATVCNDDGKPVPPPHEL